MGIFDHTGGRPTPPAPTTCGVAVIVRTSTGVLPDAMVAVGTQIATTNADGYHFFANVPKGVTVLVSVKKDGYLPYVGQPYRFDAPNQDLPIALEKIGPPPPVRPPSISRAPLPAFPAGRFDRVPPVAPPTGPDLLYYRGNFCGIRLPGAPVVPGGPAPSNADLVMACLLDNYPREWQDKFIDRYAGYGYTHLQRSIGHALNYGHSLADFIGLTKRAQARGLFADQWLLGAEALNAQDQDAGYWKPILDPIVDALIGAGAIDTACVGWQLDQFNEPGNPLISIIAYVGEKLPQSVPLYTHWVNEALAWWKTGGEVWSDKYQTVNVRDRFTWWQAMQPYLTGGHHQGDTTLARTDPTTYQDKLKDTLNPFCGDNGKGPMGRSKRNGDRNFLLTVFECTAQDQFDERCSEDQGDLTGYLLACTTSFNGQGMGGYGNGARNVNGSVL